jgi:hypothetical protein
MHSRSQSRAARCPSGGGSFRLQETDWAPYAVTSLAVDGSCLEPPIVERGPVTFGAPLILRLRYQKSDRKYVWYDWSVAPGEERIWKWMRHRRGRDNAAFVLFGDALLKLAPSADGSSASVSIAVGKFEGGSGRHALIQSARTGNCTSRICPT